VSARPHGPQASEKKTRRKGVRQEDHSTGLAMVCSMPWVRRTNPYFSDPRSRRSRRPLRRVLTHLVTFGVGVGAGVMSTKVGIGGLGGTAETSGPTLSAFRTPRAGMGVSLEPLADGASGPASKDAATGQARGETGLTNADEKDADR
jgi:hypothetical protein